MPEESKESWLSRQISVRLVSRREAMFKYLKRISDHKSMYLFQGMWMTPDEIKKHYKGLKWRHRIMFLELIGLFLLLVALTGGVAYVCQLYIGL
jgi:hypothetical protein